MSKSMFICFSHFILWLQKRIPPCHTIMQKLLCCKFYFYGTRPDVNWNIIGLWNLKRLVKLVLGST